MVAAFLQIHHHVEQRHLVTTSSSIQSLKISSEDKLVVFPVIVESIKRLNRLRDHRLPMILYDCLLLHGAQLHTHNQLRLRGHILEHVSLQSSQHVRTQHVMKFLNLIFLGNIGKFLQEALQVAIEKGTMLAHISLGYE